jgi:hypothetical protein
VIVDGAGVLNDRALQMLCADAGLYIALVSSHAV